MDNAELTRYVVSRLANYGDRDQLVFDLCRGQNWTWDQANAFVVQVEQEKYRQIALRSSPLLVTLAAGGLIAGIALTAGALYVFYSIYSTGDPLVNPQSIRAPRAFIALITGIGMILGSLWGLWKTWISIWIRQN